MSRALSPVTGKPYGVAAVCRVWRLARSCVYRHHSALPAAQRRGPLGAMSDEVLTTAIRGVLAASSLSDSLCLRNFPDDKACGDAISLSKLTSSRMDITKLCHF